MDFRPLDAALAHEYASKTCARLSPLRVCPSPPPLSLSVSHSLSRARASDKSSDSENPLSSSIAFALSLALAPKHTRYVLVLLARGADPSVRDADGRSPADCDDLINASRLPVLRSAANDPLPCGCGCDTVGHAYR